jgi:hypothetical protein
MTNATQNFSIASMDRKSVFEFVAYKESCLVANNYFFTKIWCFKFVVRKLQVVTTYYVGFHQMYGCGLTMNRITI